MAIAGHDSIVRMRRSKPKAAQVRLASDSVGTFWAILSAFYKWAEIPDFETAKAEPEKIIRFLHHFVTTTARLNPSLKEPVSIRPQLEDGQNGLPRAIGNYPTAHIQTESNLSDTTLAFA